MFSPKAFLTLGLLAISSLIAPVSAVYKVTKRDEPLAYVNVRIEGSQSTIFEGGVWVGYGNITTPSGGNHQCNGQNNRAHNQRGPTPTYALSEAANTGHFSIDGTWDTNYQDFFITRIHTDSDTGNINWGLLINLQFATVGGCQFELSSGQNVLWAYNAFNAQHFLWLEGPTQARRGQPTQFKVVDGRNGQGIPSAYVGGVWTDGNGVATIIFRNSGPQSLKAQRSDSVRSNALEVTVW